MGRPVIRRDLLGWKLGCRPNIISDATVIDVCEVVLVMYVIASVQANAAVNKCCDFIAQTPLSH
jgi:hypothetical protein